MKIVSLNLFLISLVLTLILATIVSKFAILLKGGIVYEENVRLIFPLLSSITIIIICEKMASQS